jgi:predicted ATPase/DNA-binding XRE family transcriptional regulator
VSEGAGEFAEQLRRFRERSALTQEELAARAGVTAKAISALERGERRRPYPHTVRALADALGLDDADRDALSAAAKPAAPAEVGTPTAVPLIGRERERDELVLLLSQHRLVTLTGPGGVGKTSLALAVAGGGATVVELAPVPEARLVVPTLARALGVRSAEPLLDAVAAHLGTRRQFVVLDNVEHVLDAAGDVAELVNRAPGLTVLATSRAPLRIRAEREYPLAPLPLPGSTHPDDVARSPAVQVFLDRARAAGREVRLDTSAAEVAQICRRLDGLPLALELAAAHARFLDPAALLQRLDHAVSSPRSRDLPERQRTVRATLDWSHDLLTADEQTLLRRLSVFPAGFTLEAAEQVHTDALGALGGLVEQSLVVAEDGRYRMLEPVRQYAAAKLAEAGEDDDVADRAADLALRLAAPARAGLRTDRQRDWLDLLQREHGNLAAALGRLIAAGRHGDAARLAADVWLYWALRGNTAEGLSWLDRIPAAALDDVGRAELHTAVAALRYAGGDLAGMLGPTREAAAAARAAGRDDLLVDALLLSTSAAVFLGDFDRAAAELDEIDERVDPTSWVGAHSRMIRGQLLIRTGAVAEATAALAEAERAARQLASPFTLASIINVQATLLQVMEDDDAALAKHTEGAVLSAEVGTTWTLVYSVLGLAVAAARRGMPELAAELFAAGSATEESTSVLVSFPPDLELVRQSLPAVRAELGEEAFGRAWERGRRLAPGDVPRLAAELTRAPARRTSGTSGRTRS